MKRKNWRGRAIGVTLITTIAYLVLNAIVWSTPVARYTLRSHRNLATILTIGGLIVFIMAIITALIQFIDIPKIGGQAMMSHRLHAPDVKHHTKKLTVHSPGDDTTYQATFAITEQYPAFYRVHWWDYDAVSFNSADLRWISTADNQTLTLDIVVHSRWYTLTLEGDVSRIYAWLRRMFDSPVLANRYRRLPNERVGPITARDTSGPVTVYKTPLWLVVIRDGLVVHQVQLDQVEDIGSVLHILGIDGISTTDFDLLGDSQPLLAKTEEKMEMKGQ